MILASFGQILLGIIVFVFVLGSIIAIHEGGHFFFARKANVLCREYAFGMGPILWKKKKGETLYTLRAFPIGGFCAIAGEVLEDDPLKENKKVRLEIVDDIVKNIYIDIDNAKYKDLPLHEIVNYDIFDEKETGNLFVVVKDGEKEIEYKVDPQAFIYEKKIEYQIAPYNRTLNSKTKRERAMVMFGGSLMNILLAIFVFFIAGLIQGFPNTSSNTITNVDEYSPIYYATNVDDFTDAGLRNGDEIIFLRTNNLSIQKEVDTWVDLREFMDSFSTDLTSSSIIITYLRDGVEYDAIMSPQYVLYNAGISSNYLSNVPGEVARVSTFSGNSGDNSQIKEGDIIRAIDGAYINSWKEIYNAIYNNLEGDPMTIIIDKANYRVDSEGALLDEDYIKTSISGKPVFIESYTTDVSIEIRPYPNALLEAQPSITGDEFARGVVLLGVAPEYSFSLGQSGLYALKQTKNGVLMIFRTLNLLFASEKVNVSDLSGPVGIFSLLTVISTQGFAMVLFWLGILSINIGLLNLLPIPALDGGRLVFLGYEAVTKRKPNQKVETVLITITMTLLMGLMLYVTFNDIIGLFK